MEGDSGFDAADIYEHLAFSHRAKSRLKGALNLEKVMAGEAVTFEVDADNITAEMALDDDDEDLVGLTSDSYAATYLTQKTQAALSKNAATIEALANTDFMSTSFADLESTMTSVDSAGLVKKSLVRAGTGRKVPENGKIFVHYVAVCEGSDEPCDSTLLRRVPTIIDMRKADVLPGFYLALASMELSEVSKFLVKSPLAFGEHGCQPRIPPKADILYVVEILQIIDEAMLQSPIYMTADERALLPFATILTTAEQLRTQGNGYFVQEGYWNAIKKYRKAVSMLEDYPLSGEKEELSRNQLLHTLYSNMAQSYLNLEKPAQACTMCKLGMRSAKGKENVKLLYRFAKAKFLLKDYEASINLCERALKLEPSNPGVLDLRHRALLEDSQSTTAFNAKFKGMFSKKD